MFRPLALCILLASVASAADGDYLWVEGESAATKQLAANSWYASVKKGQLSGGAWVSNWGKAEGRCDYKVDAPEDGEYTLWVRANSIGAALSYKIGDANWK